MPASLDLNLIPFLRVKGQEWPHLPGLRIVTPPKRVARGRENDRLIVYLSLAGNTSFPTHDYEALITTLAERFYQSPGAVTSGLRLGADSVNQALMERNMRTTGRGQYLLGRLVLGVLRQKQVFLALCGPVHVFHLATGKVKHIHEEQSSRNGLGANQTLPIHFSQLDLQAGETLVMCAAVPSGWDQVLNGERTSFDKLQTNLLAASLDDLDAVLVEVKSGKGNLAILRRQISTRQASKRATTVTHRQAIPSSETSGTIPPEANSSPVRPASQVISSRPASRFSRLLTGQVNESTSPSVEAATSAPEPQATLSTPEPEAAPSAPEPEAVLFAAEPETISTTVEPGTPVNTPKQLVQEEQTIRPARLITRPGTSKIKSQTTQTKQFTSPRLREQEIPEITRHTTEKRQQVFRELAKWMRGLQVFWRSVSVKTRTFLASLLPNLKEGEPAITGRSMALIAVVIPILVVMVAMGFYNRHGKAASYQENYEQAWAASVWASSQTTPADIRVGWERTLYYVNLAGKYQETGELSQLRQSAQMALDNLDSILRLDFTPAIVGGLSSGVEITRLAATNSDLYLLDSARGTVLRFYLGGAGYLADTAFVCEPGVYEGVRVGDLIDIMAAPRVNAFDATVIALDSSGALLFCRPGPMAPRAMQLATPSLGWREITGFAMDATSEYIYILDPLANAIWYYAPDSGGKYSTLPVMFFGAQVPNDMPSVVDLATNGADLYLLFKDGHTVACTMQIFEGVPKRCSDPAYYVDTRPERVPGVTIPDAYFTQMTFTEAPDQALYYFDQLAQAVYKFSPRTDSVILQSQFRAGEDERSIMLASEATAMAISPNRHIFISVSGQVYMAADVP